MALLMWAHGEESLAKSLVACKLYKAMAHEAAEDDLDTEIYDELKAYAKDFEAKGIKLLDFCYRQDAERAQRLLTCELQSWSSQSCLSLAVAANHRPLLAHPCSQVILADLWMGGLRTRKNTNLKVMLGLICPPFITKLDFKSKEELQSMPQTEEEHLENQNLDYEDLDKAHADAENPPKRKKSVSLKYEIGRQTCTQALLGDPYPMKDTKVQENGKVSLSDSDCGPKEFLQISYDYEIKQHRPLRLKKKIYEFYTAPITKFWADSMAYMIFLVLFTYTVLVKMAPTPTWQEVYSIAYITTLGCEKIREIISSEPVAISYIKILHKFAVWAWNMWNPCDAAAIIFFVIGLTLRFRPNTMDAGRVIYCLDSIYWYLRILNILGVNKYLGPLVTMMGKMVKNMIYFVVLLLVVLLSFGVSRQAILFPHKEASWALIKEICFQPYFMLYGEVFADDIYPACGEDPGQIKCVTGNWVPPIIMSMYLLIANILLINLLIAVFNNIFIEVNAVSHQVWMFQRFTVVMEYQQKPVLPPPLIAFSHCYSLLKYFIRKAKGFELPRDNGLKLFLEKDDMERLYDFEEECVEGYFREQEIVLNQSTDERIKATNDRVENMSQKIEDINQKENIQSATVQNIDFRLRKVEDAAEQILSTLAVIHRFMSAHTSIQENLHGSSSNISTDNRQRGMCYTENPNLQLSGRSKFNRSLTEVRPDAYIFDEGNHFEVRPVQEEEDEAIDKNDILTEIPIPKSRKQSILSEDSDIYSQEKHIQTSDTIKKPPFLNIIRQETTSTESRDTLTPLEASDDHTLVDDNSTENITDLNFEAAKRNAIRRRSTARRNSECCSNYNDIQRSQTSLTAAGAMSRRQLSLTQSEPDSGNEQGPVKVVAVKPNRNLLMKFHTQYTSITDELENICQTITSPTLSIRDSSDKQRALQEMSNAEIAALIERKHLKECEENDYVMLSRLFYNRGSIDETDDNFEESSIDIPSRHPLRRETAVELPVTPSKSNGPDSDPTEFDLRVDRVAPINRNLSADHSTIRVITSQNYLIPSMSEPAPRPFKTSSDSIQKNSSTDTEYSLQPYHVIKQSSNETNASYTGSFNVDNPLTLELSIDTDTSHNATVIKPTDAEDKDTLTVSNCKVKKLVDIRHTVGEARVALKKQFSMDQGQLSPKIMESSVQKSCLKPSNAKLIGALKESSSTSTDESKDDRTIPTISTNLVQDEIAKLSSNIKSSTEDDKDPPYNETMC
ncbi:Transient receptor potential cation channel trpm [Pseudolycoriella hygida]|uniref:Transient receptor potential cation channel trpm n=1 Tax=Pseudolycoriella hygida TaxID=35572 RepID=A0A9Q0MZL1_9DIPT|nr:Transient receptor potential cation channel trpm [Pseudolycoriella hygida]